MQIRKVSIVDFFHENKYDYKDSHDYEMIKHITYYTKTRHTEGESGKYEDYNINWGCEQSFLIRCLAKKYKTKSFFEIGTGRGTSCFSICDLDHLKNITTVDIIPFSEKKEYAVGNKKEQLSMSDIHNLVNIESKNKIKYMQRDAALNEYINNSLGSYDAFFIDGSHEDEKMIFNDFQICFALSGKKSVIIWDDYNDKFRVKAVADYLIENHKKDIGIKSIDLISFKGHLFNHQFRKAQKELPESGVLVMEIEKNV